MNNLKILTKYKCEKCGKITFKLQEIPFKAIKHDSVEDAIDKELLDRWFELDYVNCVNCDNRIEKEYHAYKQEEYTGFYIKKDGDE